MLFVNGAMARDIKAIKCPHCGSVHKTEVKQEFYRCENCGTEYFLDSDNVHIYHHQEPVAIRSGSTQPVNTNLPVFILIGAVVFIAIAYLLVMTFQLRRQTSYSANATYKTPRMHYSSLVFQNTATGDPVYLRIGADHIDKGNGKSELEMHTQFVNAANGKVIEDRVMEGDYRTSLRCGLTFKTYQPNMIYAIGCNTNLFELDTRNNKIQNITHSLFKDYPQLSSGIARIEFDYVKEMINIMNNEGNSYYYFPTLKLLVPSPQEAEKVWKTKFNQHLFEFGYLGNWTDEHKYNQLIESEYLCSTGKLTQRDLTPGRKYFGPKIIYQDRENLLITVNTTASASSPITIQNINVSTGKINWTLAPNTYYLYSTSRCQQGFAIEYRKGEEADYVHGVMVVSNSGKMMNDYQLGRAE
ncbi:hypothetical protein [Pedobacter agri]|uniref:Uncharacterized protein n=1 Tax=Pedobacter agri TaxID=454586 RepID=A0A9X3DC01_9SPHI|nr:hypothetical protein [Pedobacter agri]MCX3264857.1 hypothetical protein [Pedobacter agri]